MPDWVTYSGVTTATTFDLVRVADAFGDVLSVDETRALTRAIARRDGASEPLRTGIQAWMRKVAVSPHQPVRLEVASSLDLTMAGTPLKEISGQIALVLADDEDGYVRHRVQRFITWAGNDEARDEWPDLRDYVPPAEVAGIIGRMCQHGPETSGERDELIHIVGGAAQTLRAYGILDHFLMELVGPLVDGRIEDHDSIVGLASVLCQFAEHLETETFMTIVPFIANHPNDEVRQFWMESREFVGAAWTTVHARLAMETDRRPDPCCEPSTTAASTTVDARTADVGCDDLPGDIEPGQDLRGYSLRGVDLAGRKLAGCDFTGVDLTGADLRGAVLIGAVLYRAVLVGAQLDRADLSNAILSGANLRNATLYAADVVAASCIGTDFRGANLTAARFRGANLQDADLRGALTDGLDVYAARIIGATFDGIGPEGCL